MMPGAPIIKLSHIPFRFTCFAALAAVLLGMTAGHAATEVTLQAKSTLFVQGREGALYVRTDAVNDLYGLGFTLVHDPGVLRFVDNSSGLGPGEEFKIDEGDLLNAGSTVPTILRSALEDHTPGRLVYGHTRSGQVSGANRDIPGNLSTLYITPLASGELAVAFADGFLMDHLGVAIESLFSGITFDVYSDTDADGDNMSDAWEQDVFGNTSTADGISDYDGDTYTDYEEYTNMLAGLLDSEGQPFNPLVQNGSNGPPQHKSNLLLLIPSIIGSHVNR